MAEYLIDRELDIKDRTRYVKIQSDIYHPTERIYINVSGGYVYADKQELKNLIQTLCEAYTTLE